MTTLDDLAHEADEANEETRRSMQMLVIVMAFALALCLCVAMATFATL